MQQKVQIKLQNWLSISLLLLSFNALAQSPQSIIKSTTNEVLSAINNGLGEKGDSQELRDLIKNVVMPYIDMNVIARRTIGSQWKTATDDQKTRYTAAFEGVLIKTYSATLAAFSGQRITFPAPKPSSRPKRSSIPMLISQSGGLTIPVLFKLHKNTGTWLVYDIKIDGISFIANYRASLAGIARSKGIEGVIETLNTHTKL